MWQRLGSGLGSRLSFSWLLLLLLHVYQLETEATAQETHLRTQRQWQLCHSCRMGWKLGLQACPLALSSSCPGMLRLALLPLSPGAFPTLVAMCVQGPEGRCAHKCRAGCGHGHYCADRKDRHAQPLSCFNACVCRLHTWLLKM